MQGAVIMKHFLRKQIINDFVLPTHPCSELGSGTQAWGGYGFTCPLLTQAFIYGETTATHLVQGQILKNIQFEGRICQIDKTLVLEILMQIEQIYIYIYRPLISLYFIYKGTIIIVLYCCSGGNVKLPRYPSGIFINIQIDF